MATIEARQQKRTDGTPGAPRYRVRYRDPQGQQRTRTFARKVDAQAFAKAVDTDMARGDYVSPRDQQLTFGEYAKQWQATRVRRPSSTEALGYALARMADLEPLRLNAIRRSDVQAWVQRQSQTLSPTTLRTTFRELSSIFRAAVEDGLLNRSPCGRIALPTVEHGQVVPITTEQVQQLADAVPARYRALIVASAGLGVRQGEALGLTVDRVDFLRRTVRIDRQLLTPARGKPQFGPTKTPASVRTLPLPQVVADALAAHLAQFGEGPDRLIFTTGRQGPMRRNNAGDMVRRAVAAGNLPVGTSSHDLRHFYASLLISQGQSVKVVQSRLGHRSATETLDTYGHLWPDSEADTIAAVDIALAAMR